jgi:hypothetical protein
MTSGILTKELVRRVQVSGMDPDLGHFAVANVISQDLVVGQLSARSLATDGDQRHHMLVAGEYIMQFQAERAAGRPR